MLPAVMRWLAVCPTTMFLWVSAVVGFFAGIADVVQYFRYRNGFPGSGFTMNLVAGIAALLMCAFSIGSIIKFHKDFKRLPLSLVMISSAMAFVLAYLPRSPIGSAVNQDLFVYLGGLGLLASLFLYISADSPDTPDNLP